MRAKTTTYEQRFEKLDHRDDAAYIWALSYANETQPELTAGQGGSNRILRDEYRSIEHKVTL